ncbi:MAG: DEAD/DEAH box helicase [Candidatus Wallbacteria bacterium]|nr:DEAD/DEAH box helicase [Candidatus Wallbacteria bacterium]
MDAVQEQIQRRQERARLENFTIRPQGGGSVLGDYEVDSASGRSYRVTVRSVAEAASDCTCPDFRTNLLGTCKHVEAVLEHLRLRHRQKLDGLVARELARARIFLSGRRELEIRVTPASGWRGALGEVLGRFFDGEGVLLGDPAERLPLLQNELAMLAAAARRGLVVEAGIPAQIREAIEKRGILKRREWFLDEIRQGRRTLEVISAKLYPYQEEGILHLALTERAMLADDMGLGKTVQAIAAATLLRELRGVQRVLVVTPASLKHQWEREIKRFTSLSVHIIRGIAGRRELLYATPTFFTIVNYELLLREREVFQRLAPDLVILDEAQRIKNWRTKTAQAVKLLQSRYAFVLSGTPLENNLDELYSVMQFLDPRILGPLWRFNSEFYDLERRPSGHYKVLGARNLQELRSRLAPVVLRRTRDEVIQDLPDRIDNTFFVEMTPKQLAPYLDYLKTVSMLLRKTIRRALTPEETKQLFMCLQKMRVLCDGLALHDKKLKPAEAYETSPKLAELTNILQEQVLEAGRKAILFSSFEGMIDLVAEHVLKKMKIGYEKLAGSVPTDRRGALLERFREDEACRVLISTDAGGIGLNLQEASLVVNLDIPWNPAVLEQRIGRAHRLGQKRSVQVVNLISRGVLEERMLEGLENKRQLFASVFDGSSDLDELKFDRSGAFLTRLKAMLEPEAPLGQLEETALALPAQETPLLLPAAALEVPGAEAAPLPAGQPSQPRTQTAAPDAAPAEPAAPERAQMLRALASGLADRLGGRLMLLREWVRPGEDRSGLLVVVLEDAAGASATVEAALAALWPQDAGEPPPVHLFDRAAYAALVGLLGPAVEEPRKEVWRSPALPRFLQAVENQRAAQARKALDAAAERLRLARLLAANGFAADAFSPLGEALDRGLEGLLAVHSAADSPPATDLATLERCLVRPGHLKPEASARVAWVRGLGKSPDFIEPALAAVEELLQTARAGVDEAGKAQ